MSSLLAGDRIGSLLRELIAIPSENPPGDTTAIANFIASWYADVPGSQVRTLAPPKKPSAPSIIATIGDGSAPMVMLHAHIDTVPVGPSEMLSWESDPFIGEVRDEKIYGKGAVDDKGI